MGVRVVAAMCIGRARISNLSHLVEPLVRDSSPSVRAAAIYALRRCGRPADPTLIAGMLRSDDPEIRSNAFAVLGELGDRCGVDGPALRVAALAGAIVGRLVCRHLCSLTHSADYVSLPVLTVSNKIVRTVRHAHSGATR